MPKGQGKRHSPGQIVEKLRSGDAMLNAGKTVAEVIQFLGERAPQPALTPRLA